VLGAADPRLVAGGQFSSVVALTATLHFLNRIASEDRPDRDPVVAVERATSLVGPALILTSIVLAGGLAALALSDLPALRLFGWLSAFAMLAAPVGDLLILRPTIAFLVRRSRRFARAPGGYRTLFVESIPRR